jgi:WD40 repeat protein/serine/threonine protein kinase
MSIDEARAAEICRAARQQLTSDARAAYVAGACGGDLQLLAHVFTALADLEADPGQLRSTDDYQPGPAKPLVGSAQERLIAGRYKLLQKLGEGGMGEVWMAEQNMPLKRRVALKIIKAGMDSAHVLGRFEAERQALALMDHPNIARVLDGGITESGRPFFVMELVKGVPFTRFCDQEKFTPRERLELFIPVCQAVQHAHQKGLIHRDLKPSNILVALYDGKPVPKVIDFGVAKATQQRLTERTLFTEVGQFVGTPAYMPPEQAELNNVDIDTRADIYSLGVVLYELLTGVPPFTNEQLRSAGFVEMLRIIREVEPSKPSTKLLSSESLPSVAALRHLEPRRLTKLVSGDLDWIVMKCLEKERSRRYATANGLAMDIQRYLADEPVSAGKPGTWYRLRKFVRRNKGPAFAATLVILALAVGGVVSYAKYVDAKEQERIAQKARDAERERVKERDVALGKADYAIEAEKRRVNERDKVIGERDEAIGKRDQAIKAANERADDLKYQLGVTNMLLASSAYDNRDVRLTLERLDSIPPEQRRWEWVYLQQLARGGIFTLYGHTNSVASVAFSPDGRRIVTGSADNTAKVWDARTGTALLDLKGHMNQVTSVAFCPDGTRIVTGSADNTATVWDARTATALLDLKGHMNQVTSVAFCPDGTHVVTGSADDTAKVWDARTGTVLRDLKGHLDRVTSVAFSPDGTRVVTGSADQTAKMWDARTGTMLRDLKGHMNQVTSVAFSPDGRRIVTGSADKTARIWDARTGTLLHNLKGHTDRVMGVAFSPDGTRIITGSADNTAKLWDVPTGTALLDLKGHMNQVTSVAFSPDATRIATGSGDRTAKMWDAQSGTPLLDLKGHTSVVTSAAISPDGTRVVTGSYDRAAKVWNSQTGTALLDLKGHTSVVTSVAFSPDGRRIVTGSGDTTAKVWDARTGTALFDLKGHSGWLSSVAFSLDGKRIVTGSWDMTARIWDAETETLLLELKGHKDLVMSASFSPDGALVVTGSADKTAKVWDVQTGLPLLELKGHTAGVNSVSFSPDGTRIISGSADQTTKVWDARTGIFFQDLKGHMNQVTSVAFSSDGTRIVTGSADQTAKVWDARTGVALLDLKGHTLQVTSVSFSSDGRRIVTGSGDRTAKVWDARTGCELKGENVPTIIGLRTIGPDGPRLANTESNRAQLGLVTLSPDEFAYRLQHTRPNWQRYREGYEAARQARDTFVSRFYLDRILSMASNTRNLQLRNQIQLDPRLMARTGFHHPELANTPYDRQVLRSLAFNGDHLAKRLVAQELLRESKTKSAVPLLIECMLSRPITEPPKPPVEELLLARAYLELNQPEVAKRFYHAATNWLERFENPLRATNIVSHCGMSPWSGLGAAFAPVDDPRRNPFDWESWLECDLFRADIERWLAGKHRVNGPS